MAPAQAVAHGFENFELEPWAVRGHRDGLTTAQLAPASYGRLKASSRAMQTSRLNLFYCAMT